MKPAKLSINKQKLLKLVSRSSGNILECAQNDAERYIIVYSLAEQAKLLPQTCKPEGKSVDKSREKRDLGNTLFCQGKDFEALKAYTDALGYAPVDSEEMSLAFANRSAVTATLSRPQETLNNIDLAFASGYPERLKYKLYERQGKAFLQLKKGPSAQGSFKAAITCLKGSGLPLDKLQKVEEELKGLLRSCSNKDALFRVIEVITPQLTRPANERIQCASRAVDIKFSKPMGRHVVACEDIQPGDVLAVEKPYASLLLPRSYTTHCFNCLRRGHSLIPCLTCSQVFFCSDSCRRTSWENHHSVECPVLTTLLSIGCDKMELLAIRNLIMASKKGADLFKLAQSLNELESFSSLEEKGFSNGSYLSSEYISTHNLEGNTNLRKTSDLIGRAFIAASIVEILGQTDFFEGAEQHLEQTKMSPVLPLSEGLRRARNLTWYKTLAGGLVLRYLQSMPCNAHEVSEMFVIKGGVQLDEESIEIGSAVYPFLSLINHSCDPNVVRHSYAGDTVVLTAIQFIKTGEQVYDNYGFHHAVHDLKTRRDHLLSQYCFKCECVACTEDWPGYVLLPDKNPMYFLSSNIAEVEQSSRKFREVLKKILSGDVNDKLGFLYTHLSLLHRSISRPWKEYSECQEAIKQCLSLQANHFVIRKTANK